MTAQISQEWNRMKLGDVVQIESGGTPSSSKSEYWDEGNIFWATLPDLKNKYLFNTQRKITSLGLKNSSAKILPVNTVIFSSRATIGEVSIAKVETATNQGSKNLICDPEKIEYEFLYYLLKSKVDEINSLASGATYKEINKTVLSSVEINIPSLLTQKQISNVLSTYDDLIENNNRSIKILEDIAQKIYMEWFVNFRFPGYEKAKFNEDGLPEGWQKEYLNQVIDVNPTCKTKNQLAFKKVGMDRLSNHSMVIDTNNIELFDKMSGTKFRNYDTLFARITPCLENGKTGYVQFLEDEEVGFGSTEFIVMRGNKVPSTFVYCLARDTNFRNSAQKTMTGASGRQRVDGDFFRKHKITVPSPDVLSMFNSIVSNMYSRIEKIRVINQNLRETRDLLIPQLVTGRLKITA